MSVGLSWTMEILFLAVMMLAFGPGVWLEILREIVVEIFGVISQLVGRRSSSAGPIVADLESSVFPDLGNAVLGTISGFLGISTDPI